MEHFRELNLPEELFKALEKINFLTPTPIQARAIPPALEGKDILGSAQTGTGKTGAFAIPLIAKLLTCPDSSALIMTPTRELAQQIANMIQLLVNSTPTIKIALLIGGDPIGKQFDQLKRSPRIIVGTPGRINDHIARKTLRLNTTNFLILDETDRMLDMGFEIQLETILKMLPKERQTLLFSATLPNNIVRLSEKYLNNPERIFITTHATPPINITQENIATNETNKYDTLLVKLKDITGSVIIFVKTKRGADNLAKKLGYEELSAVAIHGDLRQNKRERIIASFRKSKYQIMVATDLAARGLDIPHIEVVVNYDLPSCPEDYIHRIGRTARAGAKGAALNLITSADQKNWRAIERLISTNETTSQSERRGSSAPRNNSGRDFNRDRRDSRDSRGPREYSSRNSGPRDYSRDSRPSGDSRAPYESRNSRPGGDSRAPYESRDSRGNGGDSRPSERREYRAPGSFAKSKPFGFSRDKKPGQNDNSRGKFSFRKKVIA